MTAMIDTLQFAERFESVGFEHDKARALAVAFASANEAAREDLVTRPYLDARLAEMETRLIRAIADSSKESSGRLWSAIVIIAGISTAISAGVGAISAALLR